MTSGGLLCFVTDRRRWGANNPDGLESLLDLVGRVSSAGVDLVQIREPDLDDRTLVDLVARAVDRTAGTATRILVNDRLDVALAGGAGGVHLKNESCSPERVRRLCPEGWLLGRSVHDVDEAVQVAATGAVDYLIMGTIFESVSKPGGLPVGVGALAKVTGRVPIPVLAIGGVTTARASEVVEAGAAGIAAVGEFMTGSGETMLGLDRVVATWRAAFGEPPHKAG